MLNDTRRMGATARRELRLFLFMLISLLIVRENVALSEPVSQGIEEKSWNERSWEERVYKSKYEDRYTFKHGKPYTLDPWTWGYTKEFADRFRMPEKWIEPELKGALAVAWRMTTLGNTLCGLGGKEDSCKKPLNCQLDVYYDNKINIPWIRPEVVRDNRVPDLSSNMYLEIPPAKWPPEVQASPTGGGFQFGKFNQGVSLVVNFDREFQPGIGFISWMFNGVCPPENLGAERVITIFTDPEDAQKYSRGEIAKKDVRILHTIEFPEGFIKRARDVYEIQNQLNNEFLDKLIQESLKSRK
ncbi:hypothetical protein [Methylophilus sp. 14]|uniref:hypothetical protein n=1 Tax=Methylophilus sp. 14 TaxID=2781019 RepID=UPI00188ECFBC|nr:hypothetical protein [Methylophilus sp. 14]MBF4989104.1 hypothetical protein [Methylophilus sp. 14]